jgi:ketosteroid isomerase-like protein
VLALFDGPRPPMTSAEIDVDRVRVIGDVAVVTGRSVSAGRIDGRDVTVTQRYTDIYVRRDGRWRVVASHGTQVQPD